ncbi:hypothetical protein NEMIN01_1441 [Nematocida minor]|uniref:uncharacterized protein n=1 Tax=Nematocida minor TaxID=1912983 RepID=UPI00221EA71D|nr:uncharacterized protein NEMIN01_1441 [Nematocida minor]KAI5191233.1 hypothetical protein NEMIN01_1441 [Nematocida minor]
MGRRNKAARALNLCMFVFWLSTVHCRPASFYKDYTSERQGGPPSDLININPDDFIAKKQTAPAMENEDSFLDVFERIMHRFPSFKSRFVMRFQKYMDAGNPDNTSNPSVYFKLGPGNVPEPNDILKRFQALANASSMLKEEFRSLIWQLEMYADKMFLSEKALIQKANGYISDLEDLFNQNKVETDPLVSANIVVRFRQKEQEAMKFIEAIRSVRKWETEINSKLSHWTSHKNILHTM